MQSKHLTIAAAGVAAALVAAPAAFAQVEDPGFYASGGISFYEFEGDNGIDSEVTGITGRLGWQINRWFALEGDVGFGFEDGDFTFNADEEDFNLDDNSDGDIADVINAPGDFGMNYMAAAYIKGQWPITDAFDVFGRIGYAIFDVDTTIVTPGGNDISLGDSESGASYGGGVEYDFSERHSVRLDYTYTDFDLAEADVIGLMYQFKF